MVFPSCDKKSENKEAFRPNCNDGGKLPLSFFVIVCYNAAGTFRAVKGRVEER